MPAHLAGDFLVLAPGHLCVEDAVTARRLELRRRPAQPNQVLAVILQPQVGPHIDVTGGAGELAGAGEDDRLLGSEHPVGSQDATRLTRVLDRHEVRVGAGSPFAGEVEHLGAECRQHEGQQPSRSHVASILVARASVVNRR